MKTTENYEQLLERFTKRITQVDPLLFDAQHINPSKATINSINPKTMKTASVNNPYTKHQTPLWLFTQK